MQIEQGGRVGEKAHYRQRTHTADRYILGEFILLDLQYRVISHCDVRTKERLTL